jgi:hypothetical protein
VRLVKGCYGDTVDHLDETWTEGVVIEDDREGAYDLVLKMNDRLDNHPLVGEEYEIQEITSQPRRVRVTEPIFHGESFGLITLDSPRDQQRIVASIIAAGRARGHDGLRIARDVLDALGAE